MSGIALLVVIGMFFFVIFCFCFFSPLLSVINLSALLLEVVSIQGKVLEVRLHVEAQRDRPRACVVA